MTTNMLRYQAELETLRERNRQLEAALVGLDAAALAMRLALTPTEFAIYCMLKSHRVVTREALMVGLYGDRVDNPPEPRTIDVLICKLRKKLSAEGLSIVSQWGTGWRLAQAEGGAS